MAYVGIFANNGKVVKEEDAFDYALSHIMSDPNEKEEFIEWFFSGNWVKKDMEDEL